MKFEKVSLETFIDCFKKSNGNDINEDIIKEKWEKIKLPRRATEYDAGYDFFIPYDVSWKRNQIICVATGIRAILDDSTFLLVVPRSSIGIKQRLQLLNTVGIIDSKYYKSNNEGHILAYIKNCGPSVNHAILKTGDAFIQGIILPYMKTDDDNATGVRNGGIGSTS